MYKSVKQRQAEVSARAAKYITDAKKQNKGLSREFLRTPYGPGAKGVKQG